MRFQRMDPQPRWGENFHRDKLWPMYWTGPVVGFTSATETHHAPSYIDQPWRDRDGVWYWRRETAR